MYFLIIEKRNTIASHYELQPRKNRPRKKIISEILSSIYNIVDAKFRELLSIHQILCYCCMLTAYYVSLPSTKIVLVYFKLFFFFLQGTS